jgi:hypothetical protein
MVFFVSVSGPVAFATEVSLRNVPLFICAALIFHDLTDTQIHVQYIL